MSAHPGGIWRWHDRLPLRDVTRAVSLGEGVTPLIDLTDALGLREISVLVKCEHLNPTGSFKDRIAAVALSLAAERSLRGVVGTSSGNGGAAAAAYGARARQTVVLLALATTSAEKLAQIRATGATVRLVDGLGHDPATTEQFAAEIASVAPAQGFLPFLTGARYAPEIMRGAQTIAYELVEQSPLATHLYVPVGGGGLYASLWRGYRNVGQTVPWLIAVQPSGCPTVRDALAGGAGRLASPSTTAISGLQVASLFDADVIPALAGSAGHLTEVTDERIIAAHELLCRAGVVVEPAGAAALAGLLEDVAAQRVEPGARIVVVATGAGWKDATALRTLANLEPPSRAPLSLDDLLRELP